MSTLFCIKYASLASLIRVTSSLTSSFFSSTSLSSTVQTNYWLIFLHVKEAKRAERTNIFVLQLREWFAKFMVPGAGLALALSEASDMLRSTKIRSNYVTSWIWLYDCQRIPVLNTALLRAAHARIPVACVYTLLLWFSQLCSCDFFFSKTVCMHCDSAKIYYFYIIPPLLYFSVTHYSKSLVCTDHLESVHKQDGVHPEIHGYANPVQISPIFPIFRLTMPSAIALVSITLNQCRMCSLRRSIQNLFTGACQSSCF